jgi:hypothetical protein
MIHVTLSAEREAPVEDPLGRQKVGYREGMTQYEIFVQNHGCYVLGSQASNHRYALFSYGGKVLQAVEIDAIEKAAPDSRRSVINGTVLRPGHPVYDEWVGHDIPAEAISARNPITYVPSAHDSRPCACGCETQIAIDGPEYAEGHDERSLREWITDMGGLPKFLRWLAVVRG